MENGTLRGFLLGECPGCAYDNWTSHVTEGVALPGLNNYGPSYLDPQTNGFGHFTMIPSGAAGDSILARWAQVFNATVDSDWPAVDSLLSLQRETWHYELAELWDDSVHSTFYVIREELDSSFVDVNVDTVAEDDVIGGFGNSWGLFIFHPAARRPNVIIEVVHPEDDYLSVPLAIEMFLRMDARALLLAAAGREVCWDSLHPPYANNKSYSDPSRNGRHPFQIAHQVLFDRLDHGPTAQLVTVQMHSYDSAPHASLADAHVTAHCSDDKPNPPLRDLAEHHDLVNLLPLYPLDGLSADPTLRQRVDRYISLYSNPRYSYYGTANPLTIYSSNELCGYSGNQQALYSHRDHDVYVDPENFIHIELDEYPDGLWTPSNPDWERWLPPGGPATFATYALALEYYDPLVTALDSSLWYSHFSGDSLPPLAVALIQVTQLNETDVHLRWAPAAADPAFDTYMLFSDTVPVTDTSPFVTRAVPDLWALRDYRTTSALLTNLPALPEECYFAVGSRDIWGNVQPPCSSWQVSDGPIADATLRVLGTDTLELNWSRQTGDSAYVLYRQVSMDSAFNFFMRCDSNWVRLPVTDTLSRAFFRVARVLLQ